jgi:hypothetical protein
MKHVRFLCFAFIWEYNHWVGIWIYVHIISRIVLSNWYSRYLFHLRCTYSHPCERTLKTIAVFFTHHFTHRFVNWCIRVLSFAYYAHVLILPYEKTAKNIAVFFTCHCALTLDYQRKVGEWNTWLFTRCWLDLSNINIWSNKDVYDHPPTNRSDQCVACITYDRKLKLKWVHL